MSQTLSTATLLSQSQFRAVPQITRNSAVSYRWVNYLYNLYNEHTHKMFISDIISKLQTLTALGTSS